jgi:hypothetical protein
MTFPLSARIEVERVDSPDSMTHIISFMNVSGLLLLSMKILAMTLKTAGSVLAARMHTSFQPRHNRLQMVALFNFINELVNGEIGSDRVK